jgi:hypothetical protein
MDGLTPDSYITSRVYRSARNPKAMVYLLAEKLDLKLPV